MQTKYYLRFQQQIKVEQACTIPFAHSHTLIVYDCMTSALLTALITVALISMRIVSLKQEIHYIRLKTQCLPPPPFQRPVG
jgi:hypothetical protein